MVKDPENELILVFDVRLLEDIDRFQGICAEVEPYLRAILREGNSRFVSRRHAEHDTSLKQLIPYVILRHGREIFHYVRGKEAGEGRLRSKGSIGIGGHIQPQDLTLFSSPRTFYLEAAAREVAEEVHVQAEHRERIVALINDDSTSVGRVHFGIVHLWDLDRPAVRRRERQITQSGFLSVDQLRARKQTLETWSQLCLEVLE
jgi:predicted NUDIX family phosphoesterase